MEAVTMEHGERKVDAVIMAGADNRGRLAEVSDSPYEATIDINGRAMLGWVLQGALSAAHVGRIVIVGPVEALAPVVEAEGADGRVILVERRGSIFDNLLAGLEQLHDSDRTLAMSADIPFITGEALDRFIQRCWSLPAQVHYPLIPKHVNEARFPGVSRTYIKLADGLVTGGNVFMVDPQFVRSNEALIRKVLELRKKPLALASMLGVGLIFKYITGRLRIVDVENKARSWLGLEGRGVIIDSPEIGVDVDKPSDYMLALSVLKKEATA
jgi:CTP:molybdopterin cytidylyltransferase MocA